MKMSSAGMMAVLTAFLLGVHGSVGADSGVFVTTTDFETGSAAFLGAGSLDPEVDLLTIHGDAYAEYHDGRVYVLNRLGQDNILVLEMGDWRTPALQFSVGNGSNPYDIEFAGAGKAYVSRYASPGLLIVDPRDGSGLGEIDLSGFADGDGIPEMAEMVIVGSRLYVACQRLDRNGSWGPVEDGVLVVVDMETDALVDVDPAADGVQGIELAGRNPNSLIAVGQRIVVAGSADFGDRAGGIEIVDATISASGGLVVSEETLGGDITALALYTATRGYVIITDADFVNSVRPVDLASGTVGEPLAGHSGGFSPDLAVDGERLIVADRGTFSEPDKAGLLIYDAASGELIAGPISTVLPPYNISALAD